MKHPNTDKSKHYQGPVNTNNYSVTWFCMAMAMLTGKYIVNRGLYHGVKWNSVELREFGLCCLMTPGLSKDIRCHE